VTELYWADRLVFRESPETELYWVNHLVFRESPETELSWADRLGFREYPEAEWSCLGQTAWFLESLQKLSFLGRIA